MKRFKVKKRQGVRFIKIRICCVVVAGAAACTQKTAYHQMEERELASGERHDSLFLGIKLGMAPREFFDHCWQLNRQKLVHEGAGNMTVQYKMRELSKPAIMEFYPDFHQNKMYKMPVSISYEAWAPWNKELVADSLQLDVLRYYEKAYGPGFLKVEHPERGVAYVKVNGNRRISIYKENDSHVRVLFVDLLAEREKKKEEKKS
ncbi:hypothetical protein BH24BAC1_BH24BAC1_33970 [soil metagenome]